MRSFKLSKILYDGRSIFYRFSSMENGNSFIDMEETILRNNLAFPVRSPEDMRFQFRLEFNIFTHDGGKIEHNSLSSEETLTVMNHSQEIKYPCTDFPFAFSLLKTMDSLVYSPEFLRHFHVSGTKNYKFTNSGLSVDIYTSIPKDFSWENTKNSVISWVRGKRLNMNVKLRKDIGNVVIMLTLKEPSDNLNNPYLFSDVFCIGPDRFYASNNIWMNVPAEIYPNLLEAGCIQRSASRVSYIPGLIKSTRDSMTPCYRLFPYNNGQIALLETFNSTTVQDGNLLALTENVYQSVMNHDLIRELRVKGNKHGVSTIPYLLDNQNFAIEIPINIYLLPFSLEQVNEAVETQISELISNFDRNLLNINLTKTLLKLEISRERTL